MFMKQRLISSTLVLPVLLIAACAQLPFGKKQPAVSAERETPTIAVEVTGIDGPLAANVKAHVSLSRKPCDVSTTYVTRLLKQAEEEARDALRAFGHYEPELSLNVKQAEDCPLVEIAVEPGRRVTLERVEIRLLGEAQNDPLFVERIARAPLQEGSGLNHEDYTQTKRLIESTAAARGYLNGVFTASELRIAPESARAEAVIEYDSGTRFAFGPVAITQDPDVIDEGLIDRFLEYSPGKPYTVAEVARLNQVLAQSGYFGQVDVRPRLSEPEGDAIPVDIDLGPRKRHSFTAGLGFSTDEGIRGRANYSNQRMNRKGHRLSIGTKASMIEQSLSTQYRIPLGRPVTEWLAFQAGVRRQEVDTYDNLELQTGIELRQERFDISTQDDTSTMLVPGLRWTHTRTDDPIYPRRGHRLTLEVKGAADDLLSDTSFARALLSAGWVAGTPFNSRILLRADVGGMWVDDFFALPPSARFFAGGDLSIRGYDFEELGPEDELGEVIGGIYLATAGIEYEQMITERWGAAVFVDAGNAFGGEGHSTGVKTSVGAGARWRSPIGPVRLDLAHPIDGGATVRIHLRIGPDL
jgi:translocation and assembly module TamA